MINPFQFMRADTRKIWVRLERLAQIFPTSPHSTREEAIRNMAVQQLSGETLMSLRSLFKRDPPFCPSNEREEQALSAYQSAIDDASALWERSFK